jgi:Protein of unknown function (DUF3987)
MKAQLLAGEEVAGLSPRDAWFFAKALVELALEPEDRLISRPNRTLARLLAETPADGRKQIWEEHLSTLPESEADAWIEAVTAINPADPPPEDDTWRQPLAFKLPPVEAFPLETYPAPVAHLIRHGARSIGCPLDFLALAVLSVAGAAIGRSASLYLKNRYFASASIYAACVGLPGDGKSPAVSVVANPMRRIDQANFEDWEGERIRFQVLTEEYQQASKAAKSKDSDGLADVPKKPAPPVMKRVVVGDITIESMDGIMEQNPRGLLLVLDEASALMASMNQYRGGKGSDRQWYMSTWSGESRTVDRKGNAENVPIRVPHPFLGIVGGIVPDMVGSFCDERGRHDGFIDRFLFTYPDPVPKNGWREEGIPDEVATEWSKIVSRLHATPMGKANSGSTPSVPQVVHLSPEGRTAWCEMINAHHAEQREAGFPPSLSGPWAKLEQYAGRLVLVLHMLELASDLSRDMSTIPEVSSTTVRNAALLLSYLKSHTRRVREAMKARARGEEGNEEVQTILKWIFRRRSESFSRRDLTRDLSSTFSRRAKALEEALSWLALHECIRRHPDPARPSGSRGRTPSPVYLVNPYLFGPQNCQKRESDPTPATRPEDSDDFGNSATQGPASSGEEGSHGIPF